MGLSVPAMLLMMHASQGTSDVGGESVTGTGVFGNEGDANSTYLAATGRAQEYTISGQSRQKEGQRADEKESS